MDDVYDRLDLEMVKGKSDKNKKDSFMTDAMIMENPEINENQIREAENNRHPNDDSDFRSSSGSSSGDVSDENYEDRRSEESLSSSSVVYSDSERTEVNE